MHYFEHHLAADYLGFGISSISRYFGYSLQGFTYRVDKNHALVHKLQVFCQEIVLMVKLSKKTFDLRFFNLNDERLWSFNVLCRNHKVTI